MTATIHEVLGELRATSLDERDKGDRFERLIKAYLETDPEWTAKFSQVWLWSDWPGRHGQRDTGIDLVAANRDRDDFTAIQCKFYEAGRKVAKSDIDSFLSASMRPEFGFSQRIVFDTAAGWGSNAEVTMQGGSPTVDLIDGEKLAELVLEQQAGVNLAPVVDERWFDRFDSAGS